MQITQERRDEVKADFIKMIETEIVRGEYFKKLYETKILSFESLKKDKEAGQTKLKLQQVEDALAYNNEILELVCKL
jgi:hypothetical protein